jgi:hypothetical protein
MLRLSPATLEKVLKMGASVQRFVRGTPGDADAPAPARDAEGKPLPLGPPTF